jgi:SagB-type dehydrogenase family enzyme
MRSFTAWRGSNRGLPLPCQGHALEEIKKGDFRPNIAQAALGQIMCAQASVVIAWTALFERSAWKYRQRAYRYVYLDAGHMAQNLALVAISLGLGAVRSGRCSMTR